MPTPDEEYARQKADFCLALGVAPSEYDQLTDLEVAAFIEAHNRRVSAQNKG